MIPIEELKLNSHRIVCSVRRLLMIPIEELKPIFVMWMIKRITLLMIPIEELKHGLSMLDNVQLSFWWYLLRNWNSFINHAAQSGFESFDDTYWGIETGPTPCAFLISDSFWWYLLRNWNCSKEKSFWWRMGLLMIPIEELKLRFTGFCGLFLFFWWYLLRNWNFHHTGFNIVKPFLLMIPIEELKLRQ